MRRFGKQQPWRRKVAAAAAATAAGGAGGAGPAGPPRRHELARVLSKLGVASRTESESLVRAGRVTVAGAVCRNPDRPTDPDLDVIAVDDRPIRAAHKVYLALHKPAGLLTTYYDPQDRPTVYSCLPADLGTWVFPVGRLDGPTSGLLLFTNDSRFGDALAGDRFAVEKVYEAKVKGAVTDAELGRLSAGVDLDDGYRTLPAGAERFKSSPGSTWLRITLREGKNRQVRRMCLAVGHEVQKLRRVRVGPIDLGDLPSGRTRPLRPDEVARVFALTP